MVNEDRKLKGDYCSSKREYIDALKDLNKKEESMWQRALNITVCGK
jgi:hypothetical protein